FTANSKGNNKLYLNKGGMAFEDITESAGVQGISDWCSGVTMADVNGDGLLDIYVSAIAGKFDLKGHNQLFINLGNNKFADHSKDYGLDIRSFAGQAAFFDYDHDGDLDCYILNQSDRPFQNIVDTSNRRKYDPAAGDKLLRNDLNAGQRQFHDVSSEAGIFQGNLGYGLGLAIADINNDGWEDIYIGNDFHENDYYYVNQGNGRFRESSADHFRHFSRFSMGNDIADYNNDGQPDIVTTDMLPADEKVLKTYGSDENPDIYQFKITRNGFQEQVSRNSLQRNNGSGSSFSEIGLQGGIAATDWSWSALLADVDNDGNKDLFITSGIVKRTTDLDYIRFISDAFNNKKQGTEGIDELAIGKMPDGQSHPYIFKGDGQLRFEDKSQEWGTGKTSGYFNGAAYADLDNDGDLDFVVNALNSKSFIYENKAPAQNWLSIKFIGTGFNLNGIGAKAWVFTGGKMQYQQLMPTRGFQSSSDLRLHFGFGTAKPDSVIISWPDQKWQVIKTPAVNSQLLAEKKNAGGTIDLARFNPPTDESLTQLEKPLADWSHQENNFSDFNVQYLIPHGLSTRGPRVAVADINGDGLDDFYTCGAAEQPGALFTQQAIGSFSRTDTSVFNGSRHREEVDAIFFDANGDGKPDLYVVSGGNQAHPGDTLLADQLYLNDGKGHFSKTAGALPVMNTNKSSVSAADIDQDGDIDLFVAGLATPVSYGTPQDSWLLLNDGTGKFSPAPASTIPLKSLGMATSAVFADLDKDGWPELLVTGEWMPLVIFKNNKGVFTRNDIPASTGLWQSLTVTDLNADGHPDIIAGNWGLNNKFSQQPTGPLRLYYGDFDNNGSTEQLLSYTNKHGEYPFLAKDEVERALPLLKKHYLLYADYAGVTMKDVFYGWIDQSVPLTASRLASAVFYSDGKGGYTVTDLPAELQLSPVFAFTQAGPGRFITGGNFSNVIPYEGRYDAQAMASFSVGKAGAVEFLKNKVLAGINGEVRDMKWLRVAGGKEVLLVARNNQPLLFLSRTQ
ncbi:MAG: RNA-binding protein, partial [Chitinophagaceae bacterium]